MDLISDLYQGLISADLVRGLNLWSVPGFNLCWSVQEFNLWSVQGLISDLYLGSISCVYLGLISGVYLGLISCVYLDLISGVYLGLISFLTWV